MAVRIQLCLPSPMGPGLCSEQPFSVSFKLSRCLKSRYHPCTHLVLYPFWSLWENRCPRCIPQPFLSWSPAVRVSWPASRPKQSLCGSSSRCLPLTLGFEDQGSRTPRTMGVGVGVQIPPEGWGKDPVTQGSSYSRLPSPTPPLQLRTGG